MKKSSHARQPTPVLFAMRIILFIVPRKRIRVLSKESFMEAMSVDEDRTSSPIASVI